MSVGSESVVRAAYAAYARGDVAGVLEFVHPELEWTYLNPMEANPAPQTCHGRDELARGIRRQAALGVLPRLEEMTAQGDKVLVVIRIPGIDAFRVRQSGDRNYAVLTVRDGQITALRACRDHDEACELAGIG
jgi:ketosteroid isomerase-like protein